MQLSETSLVGAWVYPRHRQSLNLQLHSETQPVPVPFSRPKVKPIWVLGGVGILWPRTLLSLILLSLSRARPKMEPRSGLVWSGWIGHLLNL